MLWIHFHRMNTSADWLRFHNISKRQNRLELLDRFHLFWFVRFYLQCLADHRTRSATHQCNAQRCPKYDLGLRGSGRLANIQNDYSVWRKHVSPSGGFLQSRLTKLQTLTLRRKIAYQITNLNRNISHKDSSTMWIPYGGKRSSFFLLKLLNDSIH